MNSIGIAFEKSKAIRAWRMQPSLYGTFELKLVFIFPVSLGRMMAIEILQAEWWGERNKDLIFRNAAQNRTLGEHQRSCYSLFISAIMAKSYNLSQARSYQST